MSKICELSSKNTVSAFTPEDAQRMVNLVRRAPYQDMVEAESASALLDRFVAFINAHFDVSED